MKKTRDKDIIEKIQENHIWINEAQCFNPSDEFLKDLGNMIINQLNESSRLLPLYLDNDEEYPRPEYKTLSELSKTLYLSINKS